MKNVEKNSSARTALITGSCGGIGATIARDLAQKGYHLILVDINEKDNDALALELPSAEAITLDLTNRKALDTFCDMIPNYDPEIAFINAGMIHPGDVTEISDKMIDLQLEINLRSAIILNKACGIHMKSKGGGNIVNTVSAGACFALKANAAYSAAKFGLRGFLMAFHAELKPFGVKVSGIYPSAVDTPMLRYEARNNGSVMNFVGTPASVNDVLKAFHKIIDNGDLEIYVPALEGVLAKAVGGLFPGWLPKLYPYLEKRGEKGRKKFLETIGEEEFSMG